jgi:hypothetical protein
VTRVVDALSRQTFKEWEVIIRFNQDSNSNSLEAQNEQYESLKQIKQMACDDSRIRLLEGDEQADVFTSLNECLRAIRGSHLKIMHPAEMLRPDALEIIMSNFAESQDLTHLTYEVELSEPSQTTQLFPFLEEIEKRRAEFSEKLFSSGARRSSLVRSVFKSCERIYQFDPNFSFFPEDVLLQSVLETGNSLHIPNTLSVIEDQITPSSIYSDLELLLVAGEIVLLSSTLEAKHLSASFSANAAVIISALESEIFARYQSSAQHMNRGDSANFLKEQDQSIKHLITTVTASTYEKLRQVKELEDSIHLKLLAVEQLKKDKSEKQLFLDSLLKSRVWRYSEPLRSARRILSRTLFFNK